MSPIIDFVRRQLTPHKQQDVANAESNPSKERQNMDIVSRSGYLNEGIVLAIHHKEGFRWTKMDMII